LIFKKVDKDKPFSFSNLEFWKFLEKNTNTPFGKEKEVICIAVDMGKQWSVTADKSELTFKAVDALKLSSTEDPLAELRQKCTDLMESNQDKPKDFLENEIRGMVESFGFEVVKFSMPELKQDDVKEQSSETETSSTGGVSGNPENTEKVVQQDDVKELSTEELSEKTELKQDDVKETFSETEASSTGEISAEPEKTSLEILSEEISAKPEDEVESSNDSKEEPHGGSNGHSKKKIVIGSLLSLLLAGGVTAAWYICQTDSDGDNVSDCFDQCPNTPTGEKVDSEGCSDPPPPPPPILQENVMYYAHFNEEEKQPIGWTKLIAGDMVKLFPQDGYKISFKLSQPGYVYILQSGRENQSEKCYLLYPNPDDDGTRNQLQPGKDYVTPGDSLDNWVELHQNEESGEKTIFFKASEEKDTSLEHAYNDLLERNRLKRVGEKQTFYEVEAKECLISNNSECQGCISTIHFMYYSE
jgi:hypothetical protein